MIIGNNVDLKNFPFSGGSIKIGIDHGNILSLKAGIPLDKAIGDFDSCSEEEFSLLEESHIEIEKLNSHKDDTDTKHAYLEIKDKVDRIIILGGIKGRRSDHFFANLELVMKDPKVIMLDDEEEISLIGADETIEKDGYKYISFFPVGEETVITLEGFEYNIKERKIKRGEGLSISNEIRDIGKIIIHEGALLCFRSKEDNPFH